MLWPDPWHGSRARQLASLVMTDTADLVIIGGGVIGVSTAFHLAEAGYSNVIVLEADQLGSGSTSKSAGGLRLQYSDTANIELALRSMHAHEVFAERPGGEIGLEQVGYLFLLTDPADVAEFESNVELQQSMGVPSRMVTAAEAGRLSSLTNVDDVLAASFCPRDGYCNPGAVVSGYALAARELGVRIRTNTKVISIDRETAGGFVIRTASGPIRASRVMCAAGPWSRQIGAMVGVELPVDPVLRPVWYTEPMPSRPDPVPMTIDFSTGFYFHAEGPGMLFGMADSQQKPGFDQPMASDWLERTAEVVAHRAPSMLDVGVAGGWVGFYETTPDHNAIIGESVDVPGFFFATGFSGHGFQLAPAIGEVMRDLVLDRTPVVDVTGFAITRFRDGVHRAERNIV